LSISRELFRRGGEAREIGPAALFKPGVSTCVS
jgi:hypothetical protein